MKCTDELETKLRKRLIIKNELPDENGDSIIMWTSADRRLSSLYIQNLIKSIVENLSCPESIVETYGVQGMNDDFILVKVDFSSQEVSQLSTNKYSKRRSDYE